MGGILGGIGGLLTGDAPGAGFDPNTYLSQMRGLNSQIEGLYANAPQSNVLGGQAFSDIRNLLGPNANGTLSTPLQAQYNSGALMNALNAQAGSANVLSTMQGRNLAGSSIAQQGLENQSMQQTLANSGLLAQLYGMQNQNSSQLAGMLGQGGMFDISQNNALLNAHAAALGGLSDQYAGLAKMGLQDNYNSSLASYQNQNAMGMDLLKMGAMAAFMPAFGGAGAAAGGSGAMGAAGSASALGGASGLGYGGTNLGMSGFGGGLGSGFSGYATKF